MNDHKTDDTTSGQDDPADTAHPLALIASGAEEQAQQESQAQEPQAEAIDPKLLAGLKLIPVYLLRALRAKIATSTPEILKHWTDDTLEGPSAAVGPLIMRYAARWAPMLGENPELTLFAVACLPLGLGYMAAVGENEAKRAQFAKAQGQASEAVILSETTSGGQPQGAGGMHAAAA